MYVIIITSLKYINFDPVKTTPDNKPPITPEPAIHPNRDGAIYRATGYYLFLIDLIFM